MFTQWDDEYIYLIMEYCSGGDLSRFIQQKRILPENVAKLLVQQLGIYTCLSLLCLLSTLMSSSLYSSIAIQLT